MLSRLRYRVWKSLTKKLVSDPRERSLIFTSHWRATHQPRVAREEEAPIALAPGEATRGIIAVQGLYYSGSSAVVGLLSEFDHVRVVGYAEPAWSRSVRHSSASECCFFSCSGFMEMVQAYDHATPEEADQRIKYFIAHCHAACQRFGMAAWEYQPLLYGPAFREMTHKLLLDLLELDASTRERMAQLPFPFASTEGADAEYDGCCFAHGQGKGQYVFYRFARHEPGVFHRIISGYLEQFLAQLHTGGGHTAFDQLLPRHLLAQVNAYLHTPIKQVCVLRDPRDQFLSAFRHDTEHLPRTAEAYVESVRTRAKLYLQEDNPHRLVLRFEDLVLRYEETTRRLMNFLGLSPEHHVAPRAVFDPALSVANIGAYRSYVNPEFMREIAALAGELCYTPDPASLPPEGRELLLHHSGYAAAGV